MTEYSDDELRELVSRDGKAFYIKLGVGDSLAKECINNGQMVIGHPEVSNETALKVYKKPRGFVREQIMCDITGCSTITRSAGTYADQVMDFYTGGDYYPEGAGTGEHTLWITYWNMRLWWTFAKGEAKRGEDNESHPESYKGANHSGSPRKNARGPNGQRWDYHWRDTSGWRSTSLNTSSEVLYLHELGFISPRSRKTIRMVDADRVPYLKSLIYGERAKADTACLISRLDENQLEWFVEELFRKMGWERVSPVGGTQKDIDMVMRQDGRIAFIQVKSRGNMGGWAAVVRLAYRFGFCKTAAHEDREVEFYFVYNASHPDEEGDLNPENLDAFTTDLERKKMDEARRRLYAENHEAVEWFNGGERRVSVKSLGRDELAEKVAADESGELYKWLRERVG